MTYSIYSTIDSDYANQSLVFFKSFLNHNPQLKLNVCCINFTDDKFAAYRNQLKQFPSITPIRVEFTDPLDYVDLSGEQHIFSYSYAKHLLATMYKLKLFSSIETDYALYLDVDMLVRRDISSLLKEYNTDFAGRCMPTLRGYEVNAGVLAVRKGLTGIYEKCPDFLKSKGGDYSPEEFYISHAGFSITQLSSEYNYFKNYDLYDFPKDPYIVHFCGPIKPFSCEYLKNANPQTKRNLINAALDGYYAYFDEWYDTFDSIKDILDTGFTAEVNAAKQFYSSYLKISKLNFSK